MTYKTSLSTIPHVASLSSIKEVNDNHDVQAYLTSSNNSDGSDDDMNFPVVYDNARGKLDKENMILNKVLKEFDVHLGGSSVGRGFRRAARFYLKNKAPSMVKSHMKNWMSDFNCEFTQDLLPTISHCVEEPFYVCDIGVVVSQFYLWKKLLPRVELFYAVKCNPDPAIIKTLAKLGAKFDCASRNEINLVHQLTKELGMERPPEIIFANPCKPRAHIIEAVCKGVRMVTFDNVEEVHKCAAISKKIQLVLRIVTDDTGARCRLSSKYGAPKSRWRVLLEAAKKYGLQVVGVSFHVGSGCRDASRYDLALRDSKELFEMAEREYGFKMHLLDIGGGFPGETHSLWNPIDYIDSVVGFEQLEDVPDDEADDVVQKEGKTLDEVDETECSKPLNFFDDIAEHVSTKIDEIFPPETGVRVIAEPGRYLVAAACTLVASVTSVRDNSLGCSTEPEPISDAAAAKGLDGLTRDEEREIVDHQANPEHSVIDTIVEELQTYSKLYASQNLVQQEVDVWQDKSFAGMLEAPDRIDVLQAKQSHTAEGVTLGLVAECLDEADFQALSRSRSNSILSRSNSFYEPKDGLPTPEEEFVNGVLTLAAAGEAAVSGVVMQAVADCAPYQDDFAYYVNDGVYGAFNNLMFDHGIVRPRVLRNAPGNMNGIVQKRDKNGLTFELKSDTKGREFCNDLFTSTIFGPTCDSIDVISRSVLLPKLEVGDWLYFQNMGAYTCAAASDFNGFTPTKMFYVCSVQPEDMEGFTYERGEEKKDSC